MPLGGVAELMPVQKERLAPRSGHRPNRHVLHVLLLCLVFLWPGAQPARAQFTRFQNFTDEQGLGNLVVDALAQDRDGYILLGTEAGLYRYDGASIAAFGSGLPSAAWIQQIFVDTIGRTWIVATDGLYVRYKTTFTRIDTGRSSLYLKSPHLLAVTGGDVVLDVGGTLLHASVGTDAVGTFAPLFDAATLDSIPGLAHARFVAPDTDGAMLIGCGVAICRASAGHVTVLGQSDGLPPDAWQVALRTADGTIWARSLKQIAWRRRGQDAFSVATLPGETHNSRTTAPGEHTSYVANPERLDLLDDRNGGVLTQGVGGLDHWDGSRWRLDLHHPGGLPADRIQSFIMDREGSLWVGSFGVGAYRSIGLGNWEHWTTDDGLPSNIVWSMTRLPNGQFWIATDSGIVATDGATADTPAETNYITKVTRDGRLWLAPVGSSLIRRDPLRGTNDRFASLGKVVTAEVDRNNRLWLGSANGLFMVADADQPASTVHPKLVLAHDTTFVTSDAAGVIWALSPDGMFRRDEAGHFELVISAAVLKSAPNTLTFAPDHEIWIGTMSSGVLRFRMTGGHIEQLSSLVAPIIGSNHVLFAYRDRRGSIWLGTDHGIDLFDGQGWRHFDSTDGPITNDVDQAAVYEDVDGSMWFGTSHGLSHLIDPARHPLQATLHPLITGLSLGNRALPVSPLIHTDWTPAPLVIGFVDLDYTRGRNIVFHYRLRGLDAGWSTTTEHEVRYAGLPAGRLDFELVAEDVAHRSSSATIGFTIDIRAPWWRRWWFYGLCGLACAAVLVAAWEARVRLLLRNQQRLEDMVGARTAEIEQARSELQHQAGELERQAIDMQRLAMSDALTGLANRRAIMDALEQAVATARSSLRPLAILLCDIDHFKKINDRFGHLAGDNVLVAFGGRLATVIGATEAVGRYGGEEFLLILPGAPEAIMRRVATIHSAITDAPYGFGDADQSVTSSGGLAFLRDGDTALSLLARADTALYFAKENGRNRIEHDRSEIAPRVRQLEAVGENHTGAVVATGHHADPDTLPDHGGSLLHPATAGRLNAHPLHGSDQPARSRDLERDLRAALLHGEFTLHYQPVVDIDRDVVTSCEALLRWQSPSRGNVPPGDFIPFAEEAGLMPEIGDWVLRAACREAAGWQDTLKVSVNLSPMQFRLPDLVDRIAAALAETGLPPERLELEVTETAMIDDMASAATMLRRLRMLGITIALDDFGTGYSSLSFLRVLPFNRIKIDRSFVQDLGITPQAVAIVRTVVGLCVSVGAATTAEGVETDQQIELLRVAGCSEIQGFRIGRPRPASEMQTWMAAFAASRADAPEA